MGDRIKRIIAAVIDWNISGVPAMAYALLMYYYTNSGGNNPILILLVIPAVFSMIALFVLRDAIFKGRSLGKRIFGLYVVDEVTLQSIPAGKAALKNVLNLISGVQPVDAIVLLVSGKSLGERLSHTRVLGKKTLARAQAGEDITPKAPTGSIVAIGAVVAVGFFFLFIVFIVVTVFLSLNAQKDTEEYAIAYEYLMQSETYADLDAADVRLNSYNGSTSNGQRTVTYGFVIAGGYHSAEVTLHYEDGTWVVCEECTPFS